MRTLLVFFLSASLAQAGMLLSSNYQHIWYAESNTFKTIFEVHPGEGEVGSISYLGGGDYSYQDIATTLTGVSPCYSVGPVDFCITYDTTSISLPNTTAQGQITANQFNTPTVSGSILINAGIETAVQTFNIPIVIQNLPFPNQLELDAQNQVNWSGGINLTTSSTIFDGFVGGERFKLRYDGGNVQLSTQTLPNSSPNSIPEPSAGLYLLLTLLSILGYKRIKGTRYDRQHQIRST